MVNNVYDALFHVTCENGTRFNYRTEKRVYDSYTEIKNLTDLQLYFNGGMEYYDESIVTQPVYTTVRESEWSFASCEFEQYVEEWMNEAGINTIIGILESGVYSNGHYLSHNHNAMEVLVKHRLDIEEIITNELQDDALTTYDGEFSFPRIVVLAFETVIKKYTIDTLKIGLQWEGDQHYDIS